MYQPYLRPVRTGHLLPGVCLLSLLFFTACQKTGTPPETPTPTPAINVSNPGKERLLSVANVYYTPDGRKADAWFYETPLVFEFSRKGEQASKNYEALLYAKENKLPVNVTIRPHTEHTIDYIRPATEAQVKSFREDAAKRTAAETVPSPDDPNAPFISNGSSNSLVPPIPVVPNFTVLNTIFNTIKSQCCRNPGPYFYGQCTPFQYVTDGCYARAHKMRQIIESFYGYASYKVFNFACNSSGTLSVQANLWGNNCCVNWWYHVASYVYVQSGRLSVAYLLDPSMFDAPVPINTWVAAQKNIGCGYMGGSQYRLFTGSNAYAPFDINTTNCTISVYTDSTYGAADFTCSVYAGRQGCF
ncbi:MAG: protein-glutamine glutaminase family protein [Bacteroidetes bacterium]|nr:protein-glutamine glutaminase family protein [Bacteroidota bacterium]